MGKVRPSAWDHVGYEDARRGLSFWPLPIGDDASDHDKECAAAYVAGYERGTVDFPKQSTQQIEK